MTKKLPFLAGIASAAHHIEGHSVDSEWHAFEQTHFSHAHERSGEANDYWNRWHTDHEYLTELGVNAFRTSLDWSKIEPREGKFDLEVLARYKEIFTDLKKRNIRVVLTLFHYVMPAWFAAKGGFSKVENLKYFDIFARKILTEYDGLIDIVIPANEIMAYSFMAYLARLFPPKKASILEFFKVIRNLMKAHFIVATIITEEKLTLKISSAEHMRTYYYVGNTFFGRSFVKLINYVSKNMVTRCLIDNRYHFPYGLNGSISADRHQALDYVGVQYYPPVRVKMGIKYGIPTFVPEDETKSWEEALMTSAFNSAEFETSLTELKLFHRPLLITEIGLQSADDTLRARVIPEIMNTVNAAIHNGLPIRGLLYFTLFDSFEWTEGYKQKFGLIEIDRKNGLKRNKKASFNIFKNEVKKLIKHVST